MPKSMASNDLNALKLEFLEYLEIEKNRSLLTVRNYDHYLTRFLDWSQVKSPGEIDAQLVRGFRVYLNRFEDEKGRKMKRVTQD